MSEKQTEALQIAQRLDWWINNTILTCERTAAEAAAELRRLDAVEKKLTTCTRSQPHESMSRECELRTEIARLTSELERVKADQQAEQQAEPVAWRPDVCQITGLPFFMWIEHHETGQMVPTYGGPYDSYTIPVRHEDGSYCRERYDHDNGWWVADEIDDVGVKIVSDQAFVCDDRPPQPAQQPLSSARIDELIEEGVFGCNPYELVRRLEEECGAFKTRPLTDEQIDAIWQQSCREHFSGLQREIHLARAIEHAHGIK